MPPDRDVQREIELLEQRYAENAQGLVFAHLADAYRRAGDYAKAEGLILHGLKNHPNYTSAYNVLGRVYLDSDRHAEAHEQFTQVLELDPHNLAALRSLADLALRRDRPDEAQEWYERMLQVDPWSEEARAGLEQLAGEPIGSEPEAEAAPAVEWDLAAPTAAEAELAGWTAEPAEPAIEPEVEFVIEPEAAPEAGGFAAPEPGEPAVEDWVPDFAHEAEPIVESTPGQLAGAGFEELDEEVGFELGDEEPEFLEAAAGLEAGDSAEETVVTETMAELYVDQGLYEDALGVYRKLAAIRPGDVRFAARMAEIEEKLAVAAAPVEELRGEEEEEELAELLELTGPAAAEPLLPAAAQPIGEAGAEGSFEFADEAPVAGLEHLDPFATSFDLFASQSTEQADVQAVAPDEEARPAEPLEPVATEYAEPLAEPLEADTPRYWGRIEEPVEAVAPEYEERVDEPVEAAALEFDEVEDTLETSAPEIVSFEYQESMEEPVPTGALDFGPPGADESLEFAGHDALTTVPEEPEEEERSLVHEEEMKADVFPAGEDIEPSPAAYRPVIEQAAEAPVAGFAEAPATTIEEYLVALLEYTPDSAGDGNAASGGGDEADQAGAGERDELDEFQNWLSGLG